MFTLLHVESKLENLALASWRKIKNDPKVQLAIIRYLGTRERA